MSCADMPTMSGARSLASTAIRLLPGAGMGQFASGAPTMASSTEHTTRLRDGLLGSRLAPTRGGLAVGGSSGRAEVREVYSGRIAQTFDTKLGPVLSVAFSPDGWRVATTNNAAGIGVVTIWDVLTGRETASYKVSSGLIERVVFSPDGRRLATSGWDGVVRLVDVATGHEVLALRGHGDRVWGTNFSPRGDALVSASADGKVLLWNAGHQPDAAVEK